MRPYFAVTILLTVVLLCASRAHAMYVDGMSVYQYVGSGPLGGNDPAGLAEEVTYGWEKVSETIYRATVNGASLTSLADHLIWDPDSGNCIWPVVKWHTEWKNQQQLYVQGGQAECDSEWDASNLVAAKKNELRAVLIDTRLKRNQRGNHAERMSTYMGVSSEDEFDSSFKLAQKVRDAAGRGSTPITSFWLGSHNGTDQASGGNGFSRFTIGSMDQTSTYKLNTWNWEETKQKHTPVNGWFAPAADVRFIGCNSAGTAKLWKDSLLRDARDRPAHAWGTNGSLDISRDGTLGWVEGSFNPNNSTTASFGHLFEQTGWWTEY